MSKFFSLNLNHNLKMLGFLLILTMATFVYSDPKDNSQLLTCEINSSASKITHLAPITITITFSREVKGFEPSDLEIRNAEIKEFRGGPRIFQCNLWPKGNYVVIWITIPANICTDSMGNKNNASQPFEIYYSSITWLANENDFCEDLDNNNTALIKDYFPWPGYANRALFVFIAAVDDNPINITSFTYGPNSLSLLAKESLKVGKRYFFIAWYYLFEDSLPPKAADIVLTCSENILCLKLNSYLLKNVLQNSAGVVNYQKTVNNRNSSQRLAELTDGSWILAGAIATTEKLILEGGNGQAINRLNKMYGGGTLLKKLEDQAQVSEISFDFSGLAEYILSLAVEVKHAPPK